MSKYIRKNKTPLSLLMLGVLLLCFGIYRDEHLTVAKKSNIICIECIGIG